MIFLRPKDAEDYIKRLHDIIEEMAKDISELTNIDIENVVDDYERITRPPSVVEEILKSKGLYPLKRVSLLKRWQRKENKNESIHSRTDSK